MTPPALLNAIHKLLSKKPEALKRLGNENFLELPVYKAKLRYPSIYVNRELLRDLLRLEQIPSWEEAANAIEEVFSTTINIELGTGKEVGKAYVDRQRDPSGIAMNGNPGSGRVYYYGTVFNIKGEKTPFAKAENPKFSDGMLDLEGAINEALVAEGLQGSLETGLYRVLAILDMQQRIDLDYRRPSRRVKLIRVDIDGKLDRITHCYQREEHFNAETLIHTARRFGQYEADKFMERIVHGCWSAGNIGLQGQMIDFDSVAAVKGRAPQFSYFEWFAHNYFGFEHLGQLEVLKMMCSQIKMNIDHVSFNTLAESFEAARKEQQALRFIDLMGFADREKLLSLYKNEVSELAEKFHRMSQYCIPNLFALSVRMEESLQHHIFDFSLFFRFFPLVYRTQAITIDELVEKCFSIDHKHRLHYFNSTPHSEEDTVYLIERVFPSFGEVFIDNHELYAEIHKEIFSFCYDYKKLFSKILNASGQDLLKIEAKAYRINEDRKFLFPSLQLFYWLWLTVAVETNIHKSKFIEWAIKSLSRPTFSDPSEGLADIHLFENGCMHSLLDGKGMYRIIIQLFGFKFSNSTKANRSLKVLINNIPFKCSTDFNQDGIVLTSEPISCKDLTSLINRDVTSTLNFHGIKLKSILNWSEEIL